MLSRIFHFWPLVSTTVLFYMFSSSSPSSRTFGHQLTHFSLSLFLGRGQFFVQRSGKIMLNDIPCKGGCAPPSYCDKGICRCPPKTMAVHGACWKLHEGVIEDAANFELRKERKEINPYKKSCSSHRHCHGIGNVQISDNFPKSE